MSEVIEFPLHAADGPKGPNLPLRQSSTKLRTFQAVLSDTEFADRGLMVLEISSKGLAEGLLGKEHSWKPGIPILGKLDKLDWFSEIKKDLEVRPLSGGQSWLPALSARFEELQEISDEEGLLFSIESRDEAMSFAETIQWAKIPSAFLVGNGNVRLLWENDLKEQVGIQFLGGGAAQFVFFQRTGDRLDPTMGVRKVDTISSLLEGLALKPIMAS